jgi:hypothetical protein
MCCRLHLSRLAAARKENISDVVGGWSAFLSTVHAAAVQAMLLMRLWAQIWASEDSV